MKYLPIFISLVPHVALAANCESSIRYNPMSTSEPPTVQLNYIDGNTATRRDISGGKIYKDKLETLIYEYEGTPLNKIADWAKCHLGAQGSNFSQGDKNSPSAESGGTDTVTPRVPGCPKYYSKLNIEWRRKPGSNPQLNMWEGRNVNPTYTYKVIYVKDGEKIDLGTLPPGQSAEAWGLTTEPPFVVLNFHDLKVFEQTKGMNKSLECHLAIRPR